MAERIPSAGEATAAVAPDTPSKPTVAVAIPAFNEGEGIAEFVAEIDQALAPHAEQLWLIVVDDASTDDTSAVLSELAAKLHGSLEVITSPTNCGHGPSLVQA